MLKNIYMLFLAIILISINGCRTGEFKFDHEIYSVVPSLITANPDLAQKIAYNEDGSPKVSFEKGTIFISFAHGLDEDTRMKAAGEVFNIFHNEYIKRDDIKKKDGTYKRDKIFLKGYVDDVELYVIEWKLGNPKPSVVSNRYGNFM